MSSSSNHSFQTGSKATSPYGMCIASPSSRSFICSRVHQKAPLVSSVLGASPPTVSASYTRQKCHEPSVRRHAFSLRPSATSVSRVAVRPVSSCNSSFAACWKRTCSVAPLSPCESTCPAGAARPNGGRLRSMRSIFSSRRARIPTLVWSQIFALISGAMTGLRSVRLVTVLATQRYSVVRVVD